ncbi:glycosyltransferase [Nonomuraea sp. NN258]|uniref:glycosyltransferase n=1 Tax=Nonomuraea antri TaxID=2730852 RepID=UPI0015687057|nr:glycosyltransferase [Nonomuraea antri]NRQ32110.1 glycosyltransferase [Nonomuraea antri]
MPSPVYVPELSVVIPARGHHLGMNATLDLVRAAWPDIEILVVTDTVVRGPTAADVRRYALAVDSRVRLLDLPCDKATAVRHGLAQATGKVLAYLDADHGWEASPDDLRAMTRRIIAGEADCLVAERAQQGWSRTRKLKTNGFIALTRVLFPRLPVRDTQTPLKVMNRRAADLLLARASWRSWAFDVELLHLLQRFGHRVAAHPVQWAGQGGELPWASAVLIALMAPGMIRGLMATRLRNSVMRSRARHHMTFPGVNGSGGDSSA